MPLSNISYIFHAVKKRTKRKKAGITGSPDARLMVTGIRLDTEREITREKIN